MKRHSSLNIHPGEILRYDVLEPSNLTIVEASKLLNVSRLTLSNIVNGKSGITPNMAFRISFVFGGTPEFWLRLQLKYETILAEMQFEEKGLKKFSYQTDK
jgi:addiction module HigA family antidote